jgi:hypothetical protein
VRNEDIGTTGAGNADREEIKELTAKYAHWVALGEGAKVAQMFTDDGAFINEVIGEKPNIDVGGSSNSMSSIPPASGGWRCPASIIT